MSDYEILHQRIGKVAVDRLVKLGIIDPPITPTALRASAPISAAADVCLRAAPHVQSAESVINSGQVNKDRGKKVGSEEAMLEQVEKVRRIASEQLDPNRRASLGQFITPASIANFMASLFQKWPRQISLLEPGAGIGSLAHAFGSRFFKQHPDGTLKITAYEIESRLADYLSQHLTELASGRKTQIEIEIFRRDFIQEAAFALSFQSQHFTHVILNPPYKKIGAKSEYRKLLRLIGVETGNLYTAFLALAVELTSDGGEIVAIIPRSFCNGLYFRPFRAWLLERVAIAQIHVFESRSKAFSDDDVLQENIIIRLIRRGEQGSVVISSSDGGTFDSYAERHLPFEEIVKIDDPEQFIHIPTFDTNGALGCKTLAESVWMWPLGRSSIFDSGSILYQPRYRAAFHSCTHTIFQAANCNGPVNIRSRTRYSSMIVRRSGSCQADGTQSQSASLPKKKGGELWRTWSIRESCRTICMDLRIIST